MVNISRQFQGVTDLSTVQKAAGLKKVKIKFGNGSSGNRGANNRGNAFEGIYATALNDWWAGRPVEDKAILKSIEHLNKTYDLSSSDMFHVNVVGGENTRRPLQFSGSSITLANTKGSGFDVGSSVTDITLTTDKGLIYLSLKLGTTTTFFNVGVRTILTPYEIKSRKITSKHGLALLKTFGIDPELFCDVFNGQLPKGKKVSNAKVNSKAINQLLQSGIGHGYHIIHKFSKRIESKKMDSASMKKAAKPGKVTVFYGGKTGRGKRVDVEFESASYIFKINIRDTQGKDGYPTRMMCDFKAK